MPLCCRSALNMDKRLIIHPSLALFLIVKKYTFLNHTHTGYIISADRKKIQFNSIFNGKYFTMDEVLKCQAFKSAINFLMLKLNFFIFIWTRLKFFNRLVACNSICSLNCIFFLCLFVIRFDKNIIWQKIIFKTKDAKQSIIFYFNKNKKLKRTEWID